MLLKLNEIDVTLTEDVRLHDGKPLVKKLLAFLAHSGDSWFDLIALFVLWLFAPNPWHSMATLMAGSIIVLALFVLAVKFLIGRKRPEGEWGAVYRNTDPHSFPSGHAARTAMLTFLAFAFGTAWLGIVLGVWCILVCLARVSLRVHYISDILAGILLGIFAGWLVTALAPVLMSVFPFLF